MAKEISSDDISLEERNQWEKMKEHEGESIPNPENENVLNANNISIVDYARKNGLKILDESAKFAKIRDPATGTEITVNKESNSWKGKDLDGNEEHGRVVRFCAKVNRIYPQSQREWIAFIGKLNSEKEQYKSSEQYNEEYQADVRKPETVQNKREKREEHPETMLANQVSIMDFAKQNHYVITHEDDKIARIQDLITEGEITVFKENNTWSIPENGTTTGGRTIRFVARMQEMTSNAASDMLVENRAKYCSSKEYNEEYAKQHSKPVETKNEQAVQKDGAVAQKRGTQTKVQEETEEIPLPTHFSKVQRAEILAGVKRGLDIKVYDKIELTADQMRELRLGLEKDVNLSKFAFRQVPAEYIKEVRLAAQDNLDIKVFAMKNEECIYTAAQAREIRLGLKAGLEPEQMKIFVRKDLKLDVMRELRLGLQDGLEVMANFNNGLYSAKDIHIVRMHLMVKQFIESLKQKMSMLFEQVREAIRGNIEKQRPEMSKEEVLEETDLQIKDIVKDLYESIEEAISEKNIEDKKEILAGVFQKVVAIGNAIEEIYPDKEKGEAFQEAASQAEDTIQQNALKNKALEALKTDYAEKFAESEQQHNLQIVEITEKLMNEPLSAEQKKEILMENLNYEMSEEAIKSIMEHTIQSSVSNVNEYRQEITEDFEMEP